MITLAAIEQAARRLTPVLRPTPLALSGALSHLSSRPVLVKPEHLQRTGSFKIRGAHNFLSRLSELGVTGPVVAASAGNHAQGVALASGLLGFSATIYMPANAAIPKVEATRGYGATVILGGESVDDCVVAAESAAHESGATFVPPFDDPEVIAGQGTIGLELLADLRDDDVIVVPVGGGGLLSGIAAAVRLSGSRARIVGVEPRGAASMSLAVATGHPVAIEHLDTMADGVAVRSVSELTLEHVTAFVDDVVTVEEEEISQAVLATLERAKWLVEPAGAVGLAAVLAGRVGDGERVVVVLSGGNIDPLLLTRLIEHGLTAAGRFVTIRVVVDDHPGALADLTTAIAKLGLNVLSVEHHRIGGVSRIDQVEVFLTAETRGIAHRDRVVGELAAQGFAASML